jgi:DNA-binding NtrC family response regulator
MSRILIVDDEPTIGWALRESLAEQGHAVEVAASVESGLEACRRFAPEAMLLDVRLPGRDGIEAMPAFRERAPDAAIIVMTAFGDLDTAVRAVGAGAFDYLVKPFDLERVSHVTERAIASRGAGGQLAPCARGEDAAFVGASAPMQAVFKQIALAAPTELPVLITGETGTGKELAARAIHAHSRRRDRPMVVVNLAALAPGVAESELFGHVKGAFTGATSDRKGLFDLADGGTLLLDEIAESPPEVQVKLLRALETGEIWPVGGQASKKIDVRLIAATNRDLPAAIAAGEFRGDLYHRLRAFPIEMPPLAARPDDLDPLVEAFLGRCGAGGAGVDAAFLEAVARRPWPGNVRELRHAVEYAAVMARGGAIGAEHLPPVAATTASPARSTAIAAVGTPTDEVVEDAVRRWFAVHVENPPAHGSAEGPNLRDRLVDLVERSIAREAIRHASGNRTAAAKLLGLDRATLRGKLADS